VGQTHHHPILGVFEMATRTTGTSPQVYARIAGILYLLIIVLGAEEPTGTANRM
jgi:hypothetical protein